MMMMVVVVADEAVFPWFDPPATPDGRGPRHGPYALAWRRMYMLSRGPFLVRRQRAACGASKRAPTWDSITCHLAQMAFTVAWHWMQSRCWLTPLLCLSAMCAW